MAARLAPPLPLCYYCGAQPVHGRSDFEAARSCKIANVGSWTQDVKPIRADVGIKAI
jgi:hypothetical protein